LRRRLCGDGRLQPDDRHANEPGQDHPPEPGFTPQTPRPTSVEKHATTLAHPGDGTASPSEGEILGAMPIPAEREVEAGAAILRGSWEAGRRHFERALEAAETAEALDGLGVAERSLLDEEAAFDAHERGYRLARQTGDHRLAARLAID